ncbi:MAG TPA: LuxR C-terminal-related transcriptional regulator, partial [Thermomicrobiales bacterium]|nr:LuxR C-terminal-related transcriptional regulator [Thermomicrobiales bacterium]
AVFVGGFTLDAASWVAERPRATENVDCLDLIASLIDSSLLLRQEPAAGSDADGAPRYLMLETIREYAGERLAASGEADATRAAHAAWFLALAERAQLAPIAPGHEPWLDRFEAERGNLRAALAWLAERGERGALLRLAAGLRWFWYVHGPYDEAREWLTRGLAAGDAADLTAGRAAGMLGLLTIYRGDLDQAGALIERALALCRQAGDALEIGLALLMFGRLAFHQGRLAEAESRTREALRVFEQIGDGSPIAAALASDALSNLGCHAQARGEAAKAAALQTEALARQRRLGFGWGTAQSLLGLADVARVGDDLARAAALYRESLALSWRQHDRRRIAPALAGLAAVAAACGRDELAARLFGAAATLLETIGLFALFPFDVDSYEAGVAALRATMGEDAFRQAWETGRAAPLDRIVAEAAAFEPAPQTVPEAPRGESSGRRRLSPREREVLRLLVEGKSDREIADALFISYRTVTNHVASILAKLDAPTRTAAATIAVRQEFV